MHPWMIVAGAVMLTPMSAAPLAAQERPAPVRTQSAGHLAPWFYHQVSADCDRVIHTHGRNAAWGHWQLPLSQISAGSVSALEQGASLSFDCLDGSACISKRRLGGFTDQTVTHEIPFETVARAEDFLARLSQMRSACRA